MVALQILSKVLATKDTSIIDNNNLTEDYFVEYQDEYNFIINHKKEYGTVPDEATFLSKFDVDLVEVTETDRYLIDTIREEYLYYKSVPVVQKIASLLKDDANAAAEYMLHAIKELQPDYGIKGVDIIHEASIRQQEWIERKNNPDEYFFTTGFQELDDMVHGWRRGEEFVVILARTNHGKSWVLEKMVTHIWQLGYNVGYISPEMGASSIGYRFDTLYKQFSNSGLSWGKDDVNENDYNDYVEELGKKDNKFIVSTPADFANKMTVSKLRQYIKQYKLDILAIDGVGYLSDERAERGDSTATKLKHIGEDLMSLSVEMNIPILVVAQANRTGITEGDNDTPDIGSVRDGDGLAFNATVLLALKLKDRVMTMEVKKARNIELGKKIMYQLDINVGDFKYIPSNDVVTSTKAKVERKRSNKPQTKEDVF